MKWTCAALALALSVLASAEEPAAAPPEPPKLTPPKLSGYFQPSFLWGTGPAGPAGNFFIRRLRVKLTGEVFVPEVTYTFMFDFAALQRPLRDGYLSFKHLPMHEVRIGQFKVPFGWENPTSATVLPTIERALVSDNLGRGPDLRDYGLGLFGSIPLGQTTRLEHAIAVVNGAGANNLENTPRKDVFARVGVAHGKLIRGGVSGASVQLVNAASARETSLRIGGDLEVELGPAFFMAEYVLGRYSEPAAQTRSGFHATAGARMWGVEPLVRFEQYSPDDSDATTLQRRLIVGANYYFPSGNVRLMANYRLDLVGTGSALLLQGQLVY